MALSDGETSEYRALPIVKQTALLSAEHRRIVDTELAGRLGQLGNPETERAAARIAYRLEATQAVKRTLKAETDRRVSIRPAPSTKTWITALLPVVDGVAVYAALTKRATTAKATGNPRTRTRDQIMADEFVSKLTTTTRHRSTSGNSSRRNTRGGHYGCRRVDPGITGQLRTGHSHRAVLRRSRHQHRTRRHLQHR